MASFRLFDLNDAQRAAVTQTDGPVLILAGAGTGKTRVITARIAYLLAQGVEARRILAVTFTNKAAGEMKERVGTMVDPDAAKGVTIATFHALCVRLLRTDIERLGWKKNFSIYDQGDCLGLIRGIITRTAARDEKLEPNAAQSLISKLKNDPRIAAGKSADESTLVGAVFTRYQAELKRLNAVDFDDLLLLAVRLLREHPDARDKWRARFHYLMVDEFQDTNRLQLDLVSLLAHGSPPNVCVVGDDDQSIYGWRGAEVANILEFERHFPQPKILKLEQNYRSTNAILHTANSLIKNNPRRRPKTLWSEHGTGDKVQLVPAPNEGEEAAYVINEIHRRRAAGEAADYRDFAVIYRTNAQGDFFERELRAVNIPCQRIGGTSILDRREVKDLLAFVACLLNADDDVSLLRIINLPPRGLGDNAIERALAHSMEKKTSLFAVLGDPEFLATLSARTRAAFQQFAMLLDSYESRMLAPGADYAAVAGALLDEIGFFPELRRTSKTEGEATAREINVRDLLRDLERYQRRSPDGGLRGFIDRVSLDRDRQEEKKREEQEAAASGVTLITLHAAKGLEFPHVFLVGLEEGLLPHERSRVEGTIDEERRLFYVGITRARRALSLSYCATRTKWGTAAGCTPSSFLRELSRDHLAHVNLGQVLNAPAAETSARSHFSRLREMLGQR
ncbi:MAG: UvrD-helicase domain-containing protein [Verrucomicrobia bacterium]|nr:UvrD-helicase domain-containing protein [Verrucomicrobiota bacterium]MBV9657511.1 UvrD-helicase domain-containing protein [Verrucomicrobiota bacterium]